MDHPVVASAGLRAGDPRRLLDAVLSTMVMEHVPDEATYLAEIRRVLALGSRAYITTVFETRSVVLPQARRRVRPRRRTCVSTRTWTRSHARLRRLRLQVLALELRRLWFPLLDPSSSSASVGAWRNVVVCSAPCER